MYGILTSFKSSVFMFVNNPIDEGVEPKLGASYLNEKKAIKRTNK